MAPEQVLGARHVDARADIWSLGAVLYEMLTGRPPYDEKTIPRLLRAIDEGPPPAPSLLRPTLPAAIDPVVLACLEREPDARLANVAEVASRLLDAVGSPAAAAMHAHLTRKLRRRR
jgi:serine/threonine-protein kinase